MKRTPAEVDNELKSELDEKKDTLRSAYADRINAGLPLTLEEWKALSKDCKDVWEECLAESQMIKTAMLAHFIADSMAGGTLAVEAVWEILPAEVQGRYVAAWSRKNAQSEKIN